MTTTPTLTIRITEGMRREHGLASRLLDVEVLTATEKAVQVRAWASTYPADHCHRCGRPIENMVSRMVGYGPWCSDELGIPRDFTEDQIDAVRESIRERTLLVTWLPRRSITLVSGVLCSLPAPTKSERVAQLRVNGDRIEALTPFEAKDIVKAIPGAKWDREARAWTFPASEHSAHALVVALRGATVIDRLQVTAEFRALVEQRTTNAEVANVKVVAESDVPPVPVRAHGTPEAWPHQARAFHFARGQAAAGLFIGMGGGKSRVAVELCCDADDRRVLIVCPNNVVGVWPKQFRLYADREYTVLAPRKGTVAKRAHEVERALSFGDERVVVVVNYESAWRDPMAKLLVGQKWDRVILDESHRIKSGRGRASSYCAKLRPVAARRLCLTGTPMPHSPLDVWAQYRFLDPGVFGTSFVAFRSRYAIMGGYGGYEVLGYQRQDELAERMYRCAFRIADAELDAVLGLEEPIHEVRECVLSPRARREYDKFWRDMVVDVGDGVVTASNALVRLLRLQQLTSGHVPVETCDDEGAVERSVVLTDTAKRDALEDLVEDIAPGEPVVVFCRFTHDLDQVEDVARSLGRTYAELSGRRKDALTEDSTLAEHVEVAGVQIQSGGVGIDLSRSHYCVFYSVGFSLGDYDQALKRTHRPGQQHRVTYYHVVAADTVDLDVYDALRNRKDVVDYVLNLAK